MGLIGVIVYVTVAWVGLAVLMIGLLNLAKSRVRSAAGEVNALPSPTAAMLPRPLPAPNPPQTGRGTLPSDNAPRSMSPSAKSTR
jgi:hypothetical protein